MDGAARKAVTLTLDATECDFLITVLRASGSILNTLKALHSSLPDTLPLPLSTDAIVNILALADRIEQQFEGSD